MAGRAIISAIRQDEGKIFVQVKAKNGELLSDVELIQQHGFRSMPRVGSRGLIVSYAGDRDNSSVFNADDKRINIPLAEGESVVYNGDNTYTIYRENEIETTAPTRIKHSVGDAEIKIENGKITMTVDTATWELTSSGVVSSEDGVFDGISVSLHTHPINSGSSAPGPTGTPT